MRLNSRPHPTQFSKKALVYAGIMACVDSVANFEWLVTRLSRTWLRIACDRQSQSVSLELYFRSLQRDVTIGEMFG